MEYFIWTIVWLLGIESVAKLFLISQGKTNSPTLLSMACDIVIQVGLIIWAFVLLFS